MGSLKLITSVLALSALSHWVSTQELHHQLSNIGDLSNYRYNIHPIATRNQNYVLSNNYAANIPVVQNHQIAFPRAQQNYILNNNYATKSPVAQNQQILHNRAGYNVGNSFGGYANNFPLYTEKKITTIRKHPVNKLPPKNFHRVQPFKQGQLKRGKSSNFGYKPKGNQGYGNQIPSFGNKGQRPGNWIKGSGKHNDFTPYDFAKTANTFNKQIELINLASFNDFKQDNTPQYSGHSNGQSQNQNTNKQPFDYIPVNLDSKINNQFNFNTDLKTNNNVISGGYKQNNYGWNQNKPASINSEPVKYQTFVPGVSDFDTSSGKINNHGGQSYESFIGQGKGGEPTSFVKVTNGNVSYNYHIRHLANKH